jgi:RNA polymerase sigma-70 factor (ECF subfamily)
VKTREERSLELVRRAQAGEREAFEMLVERHAAEIYRLAAAIVGEADARDVAQETFVTAWQQLPRLRRPGSFDAWIRRTCVNRSRNWLRSRDRRGHEAPFASIGDLTERVPDRGGDFRGAVEARALLEPAFHRLSVDQRAVLALHYSMGYSIAEAADALGVRVGTAKSRLSSGLARLRAAIGSDDGITEAEVVS